MSSEATSRRLVSIDLLRGCAALAVVLHHACLTRPMGLGTYHPITLIEQVSTLGFIGVWLFFVISGFCIHMRYARAQAEGVPRSLDFFSFWKRRIIRLYPTYLVCLLIYAVLRFQEYIPNPRLFLYNFLAHVFMVHNLDSRTVHGFCGVFWTLALEEQLYLAYFLLLFLRGRFGWMATLIVCFGARALTYGLFTVLKYRYGWIFPVQAFVSSQWFVWALGALSVEAYLGIVRLPSWCRSMKLGFGLLACAAVMIFYDRAEPGSILRRPIWFFLDPLLGVGFFVVMNASVNLDLQRSRSAAIRWMVQRLAGVGLFSYSLYLTHQLFFLHLAEPLARVLGVANNTLFLLALAPFTVLFARLFFIPFESPFIQMAGTVGKRPLRMVVGAAEVGHRREVETV